MSRTLLVAALLVVSSTAFAGQKIAVLDIQTSGVDESLGPTLTEILSAEIEDLGIFEVIAGSDINAMLGFESQKDALGCDDASCIAELGGALGVDKLVVGSVGKVGETYVLNLKLLNIAEAKTEKRVYKTLKKVDELIVTVRSSVNRMFVQGTATKPAPKTEVEAKTEAQAEQPTIVEPATVEAVETTDSEGGIGIVPIVLWSVGGASMLVGIIAGIRAKSLGEDVDAYDPSFRGQDLEDRRDEGRRAQLAANISYGVAIASVSAGFALWLFGGSDDTVAIGPWLQQPGATVSIRF